MEYMRLIFCVCLPGIIENSVLDCHGKFIKFYFQISVGTWLHGFCFTLFPARPTAMEVTTTAVVVVVAAAAEGGVTHRGEGLVGAGEGVEVVAQAGVGAIRRRP